MNGSQDGKYYKFAHPDSQLGDPNVMHRMGWDFAGMIPNSVDGLVLYRRALWYARLWRWLRYKLPSYRIERTPF